MKHLVYIIIIFITSLFLATPTNAEEIVDFKVDLTINTDASIDVYEQILYDFGDLSRHGIYREIPYKYKARGGNFSLLFSDFSVSDDMNNKWPVSVSKQGKNHFLRIGDPDRFITGLQKYNIKYRVERAINYFKDGDELYWNVTGQRIKKHMIS